MYLYNWVFSSKPPFHIYIDDEKCFYINYTNLSEKLNIKYRNLQNAINRLKGDDKNNISFIKTYYINNKNYIAFNLDSAELALDNSEYNLKLLDNLKKDKEERGNIMLFDCDDMFNKVKINVKADAIAKNILNKYPDLFRHKTPVDNRVTKTYKKITDCITDIYNGLFSNDRYYPKSEDFLSSKQFNFDGWKDKLKEVKGDWNKVENLIYKALDNFTLMKDDSYMPRKKDYLQTNLSLWFYDRVSFPDEPKSQFIACLNEPLRTDSYLSEIKADKIYDTLPKPMQSGGNSLYSLNFTLKSGYFWSCMQKMYEWCKLAFEFDDSMGNWMLSPSEIANEFYKYCVDNDIDISPCTINIETSVEKNAPWVWFIKDNIKKYGLNKNLFACVNKSDFEELIR